MKEKIDKQAIEEMANIVCEMADKPSKCKDCGGRKGGCFTIPKMEKLYAADYRKQSEPISCGHEKGGRWISVDERLPDRDGRYLVAMKNGEDYHISTRRFKRTNPPIWWKGHTFGYWARQTCGVRYWMPLPEPPKMKGGAE